MKQMLAGIFLGVAGIIVHKHVPAIGIWLMVNGAACLYAYVPKSE